MKKNLTGLLLSLSVLMPLAASANSESPRQGFDQYFQNLCENSHYTQLVKKDLASAHANEAKRNEGKIRIIDASESIELDNAHLRYGASLVYDCKKDLIYRELEIYHQSFGSDKYTRTILTDEMFNFELNRENNTFTSDFYRLKVPYIADNGSIKELFIDTKLSGKLELTKGETKLFKVDKKSDVPALAFTSNNKLSTTLIIPEICNKNPNEKECVQYLEHFGANDRSSFSHESLMEAQDFEKMVELENIVGDLGADDEVVAQKRVELIKLLNSASAKINTDFVGLLDGGAWSSPVNETIENMICTEGSAPDFAEICEEM